MKTLTGKTVKLNRVIPSTMSRPRDRSFLTSLLAYNGRGRGTTGQSGFGNRFAILNASPPQLLFAAPPRLRLATEKTFS
ncbi:hypothetical protein RHMOL_Rhmol08G0180400 [Rhododendron molle]|uniref:Uncharacterized protein n=1 Tax=Rhododendron molle TaxID=49168 RepID=A0ACC0MRL8_RHOML|nr:hypothetical protein RHMOL_Rhmol08G0180400 [Rhododendron molle]